LRCQSRGKKIAERGEAADARKPVKRHSKGAWGGRKSGKKKGWVFGARLGTPSRVCIFGDLNSLYEGTKKKKKTQNTQNLNAAQEKKRPTGGGERGIDQSSTTNT